MWLRGWLAAVLVLATGACTGQGSEPTAPGVSVMPVPAGCDPSRVRVDWTGHHTRPALTTVTRYVRAGDASTSEPPGTRLVDVPFAPSVAGVAAPAAWLTALAKSLQAETGAVVHGTPPSAGTGSVLSVTEVTSEIVVQIAYSGVREVRGDFAVHCGTVVRGTFVGWSSVAVGVVTCRSREGSIHDEFDKLALSHCSTPSTPPSGESPRR